MNQDKVCLHPIHWPDVCGHGASTYIGTVVAPRSAHLTYGVQDVYLYEPTDGQPLVCLRSGPKRYTYHHMSLDTFWAAADAYPPWTPARDMLLSQGFAP